MKAFAYALVLACSIPALGQVKPIGTGDMITWRTSEATYGGKFGKNEKKTIRRVEIDAEGNRKYVNENGTFSVFNSRFGLTQSLEGNRRPVEEQFPYLPPEGVKLEPGAKWQVKYTRFNQGCFVKVYYTFDAVASPGPEMEVEIDGKQAKVPTVKIDLTASPQGGQCPPWQEEIQVFFSQELGDIVSTTYVNHRGSDLKEGNERTLLSVKMAGK